MKKLLTVLTLSAIMIASCNSTETKSNIKNSTCDTAKCDTAKCHVKCDTTCKK